MNINHNNINTFNYNSTDKIDKVKDTGYLIKKRNRINSFEGVLKLFPNLEKDLKITMNPMSSFRRKTFDENDYINNFNCTFKESRNSLIYENEQELENMKMVSQSDDFSQSEDMLNDFIISPSKPVHISENDIDTFLKFF